MADRNTRYWTFVNSLHEAIISVVNKQTNGVDQLIGKAYDALQEGEEAKPTGGDRDLGETEELIEWVKLKVITHDTLIRELSTAECYPGIIIGARNAFAEVLHHLQQSPTDSK